MKTEQAILSDGAITFLNGLKNIKGESIAARKKNYFHLLDAYQNTNPNIDDVENVALKFEVNTHLEEMFRVEFLIRFRVSKLLLETLLTASCQISKKILSLKWLFHSQVLVQEILPYCSKSTRESVLLKLGLYGSSDQIQEYYYLIKEEYGLDTAKLLLNALPNDKILDEVYNYGVELRDTLHQVVKDPLFLDKYLEALKNKRGNTSRKRNSNKHYKSITYLANYHSILFMELIDKHDIQCKLSTKATSVIVRKFKDKIVSNPQKFFTVLNMPIVVRLIQKTSLFPVFLTNLFPKLTKDFCFFPIDEKWNSDYPVYCSVHSLSKEDKYRFVSETFEKVYGVKFYECSDGYYKDYLFDLMPHEELKKYISERFKNMSDVDVERIICLPVNESIPLIMGRINKTDDLNNRSDLVVSLAETCVINDDKEALFEVLTYVVKRHRNDTTATRSSFLDHIRNINLEELSHQCWVLILELLNIFKLKDEDYYSEVFFRMKYIHKLLLDKLPFKEELSAILKVKDLIYFTNFNLCPEQPEIEKYFISEVGRLINENSDNWDDLNQYQELQLMHLMSIVHWNKRHKEDCISIKSVPSFVDTLINMVCKEECDGFTLPVFKYLMTNKDYIQNFELYSIIWRNHKNVSKEVEKALLFLLRYKPNIILDRLSDIFKIKVKHVYRFLSACVNYTHIDLPQIFLKRAIHNIESENMPEILFSIDVLSHFVNPAEYEKYLKKFLLSPNDPQMEETVEMHAIRKKIAKNIKYLRPLPEVLDVFLKYIKGDFLENSIGSVRFIIYHLPSNIVDTSLQTFYSGPISVRKHSLYLSVDTSQLQSINFLKSCGSSEKNTSVRKFIIKNSLRLFLKNPTDESLELLKTNACIMEKDDYEAYRIFYSTPQFPNKYFASCMELSWKVLETCTLESIKSAKYDLFKNITDHQFNMLDSRFIEVILEAMFAEENIKEIPEFCKRWLWSNSCKVEIIHKANTICQLLNLQIQNQVDNVLLEINKLVNLIITAICKESVKKMVNIDIYNEFFTLWIENFPRPNYLGELILLTLTRERLDHQWCQSKLASKLLETYDQMYNLYGWVVIPIFTKTIQTFFDIVEWLNVREMFDFLEILLEFSDQPNIKFLVLSLLPQSFCNKSVTKDKHLKILSYIKSCNNEQVKIAYNQYFTVFSDLNQTLSRRQVN